MGTQPNPIAIALRHWPRERFPDADYEGFWCRRFQAYDPASVAEAINVLVMESDPYLPTCEKVQDVLERWAIVPFGAESKRIGRAATPEEAAEMKARIWDDTEAEKADRQVCERLGPEKFMEVARLCISQLERDIQTVYANRRRPFIESLPIRRMVAEYARVNQLVLQAEEVM